jgi:hypothetical protein
LHPSSPDCSKQANRQGNTTDSHHTAAATVNAQYPGSGYGGGNPYGDGSGGDSSSDGDGFGDFDGDAPFDVGQAETIRHIHGGLAALAFVAFFPIGSILMRVVPGRHAWLVHGITQVLGYCVYVAAAALGIHLVQMVKIPPNDTTLVS